MVNDGRDKNLPAHHVDKGDPKLNGPFLDDIRADQERAYRESRQKAAQEAVKKIASAPAKKTTAPKKRVTVQKKAQKGKK